MLPKFIKVQVIAPGITFGRFGTVKSDPDSSSGKIQIGFDEGWQEEYLPDQLQPAKFTPKEYIQSIATTVDNRQLSDPDFRQMIRSTLPFLIDAGVFNPSVADL